MAIEEKHLEAIEQYSLFCDLLDSNGIVDDTVLEKLRLNIRGILEGGANDPKLLDLCRDVIFHDNMKALGLHQLILLFIDWQKERQTVTAQANPDTEQ